MATLHFLFSDIEGSTRLWDEHPLAMRAALAKHDQQIRDVVESNNGVVFKNTGDGAAAVFQKVVDALVAAAEAQRALTATEHADIGTLDARMAVHSGTAEERDGDFFGPSLSRAARLMGAAHGKQVLTSAVSEQLAAGFLPDSLGLHRLGEHRLRGFARPEGVFQLVGDGLLREFPPLRTPYVVSNNLPLMPTSFVGRDKELGEVANLMKDSRLVTLTGAGGSGKTRLALEAASEMNEEFADGVWFVGLGAVTDPDLVGLQAANALRIQEQAGMTVVDKLFEHLHNKEVLLVIDNCEHLVAAVADFTESLLAAATSCKVLATSRELLNVGGEVAYGLHPMSLPDEWDGNEILDLDRYDAVRLFVERALAAKPDFAITPENASAVAQICQRLDGIPLGIELAAARLRSLTPQQIAGNLDENFRTLSGGSRTAIPRQQTLTATIDWSYRLLDPQEQVVFNRLAVFQSGFDLDAARQVVADAQLDEFDVLELVPALVDKSLIAVDFGGNEARYRLLEMLRQYATGKLAESGEADDIERSHAEYFRDLAEEAEPNVRGEREKEWWDRIELELDNFRHAMEWSLRSGDPEVGIRLAGAIWRFWKVTFRYSAGVRWLGRMIEAADDVEKIFRAKVLLGLGTLLSYTDDPGKAGVLLEGAIEIYKELDDLGVDPGLLRHGYPSALISLATNLWQHHQDFDRAIELWNEALEVGWRVGDGAAVSMALGNLAEAAARAGDVERARAGYVESVQASYAFNSTASTVEAICLAAVFEMSVDESARALPLLDDAISLARSTSLSFWVNFGRAMRAVAAHDLGDSGAQEEFAGCIANFFADPEFLSTLYYQLPMVLWRADLENSAGHPHRAAMLVGVLESMERQHSPLEPIFAGTRRKRLIDALLESLGEEDFDDRRTRGHSLSREDATRLIVDS